MGALTSKITEFKHRPWEPRTIIEIDDSEVSHFNVRTEKLKTNRIRYLPIQYWISDKKRFSKISSIEATPSIHFSIQRFFFLTLTLKESKTISYLISNINGYYRILNKLFDINIKSISGFFAKRFTLSYLSKINIMDDLLINRTNAQKELLPSFDKLPLTNEIILLTNIRMESPALNAYLFKNSDKYSFVSFSTFASNIQKVEIPLSSYTINAALQGFFDLDNKTIITSCINSLPPLPSENLLTLTPRYLNKVTNKYYNLDQPSLNFIFSLRSKQIYQPIFLSNDKDQYKSNLSIGFNSFDQFVLKQINHKFLERLFILASILKPQSQSIFSTISSLQITKNNGKSILFQTTKTI
jgi:hypothetical protein